MSVSALRSRASNAISPTAGECLHNHKSQLMESWRQLARKEMLLSGNEPRHFLLDSLPQFLDELINSLSIDQPKLSESRDLGTTHGTQRSNVRGYTLTQVISEYHILTRAIFSILDEYYAVAPHERNAILQYIEDGKIAATKQFTKLVLGKERRNAEVIRHAEHEFRPLANSIPQLVWIADANGKATWFNDQWYNFTGKKPREVIGLKWMKLLHPDQEQSLKGRVREIVEKGTPWELTYALKGHEGEWRWFLSRGSPFRNAQGKVVRWFGTNTDITEQRNTEQALEKSKEKFWSLINAIPSIAWTAEPSGNLDFLNERFYQYTGTLPTEPPRQDWKEFIHPDELDMAVRHWTQGMQSGKQFRFEFRLKRAADSIYRWHLARGVPVKSHEGHVIKWFGLTVDIEDQKHAQAELEEERALRELFINTLSHDLKSPLTTAKAATGIIALRPKNVAMVSKLADTVLSALNRAERMIRDLLDINRIRAGKGISAVLEMSDLVPVIREMREEFSTTYGDRFIFSLPETMWGLWSKEDLRRVLENLLSNAIKYGDPTKPISVEIKMEGHSCLLCVHNFGTPIAAQDQAKLFEPFTRNRATEVNRTRGWGIGLALVKGIVDVHKGSIKIESSPEAGTTFIIKLPIDI